MTTAVALVEPPATSTFQIRVDSARSSVTVVAHGCLDERGSDLLRDALRPLVLTEESGVLLDLADVAEVHPATVAMLVHLRNQGLRITCLHPSPAVERVLEATGAALILGLSPA
jgi:anti-anti-sigma factor